MILWWQIIFDCNLRFRWRWEKCPTRLHAFSLVFPILFFCVYFITSSRSFIESTRDLNFPISSFIELNRKSLAFYEWNARRGIRAPTRFLAQFSTRLFSLNGSDEEDPWSVLPRRENFRKFVERSFSPARRILTRVLLIVVLTQRNALRVCMRAEKFS